MNIRKVLKGINGIDETQAKEILKGGIICNWWRKVGSITPESIQENLTEHNLDWHLNNYNEKVPLTNPLSAIHNGTFGEVSPFISTTAGAILRDEHRKRNIVIPPYLTAFNFATKRGRSEGCIFYAYLTTIEKSIVEMQHFAEDVRNYYSYSNFLQYYKQGEITAKIIIPSIQIEKVEGYFGKDTIGKPTFTITNPNYLSPDRLSNIHELTK